MLSRIYYAVATTALVATMGVLEGAQHAQSLKFRMIRMTRAPQSTTRSIVKVNPVEEYVLRVQSYSTPIESKDIKISVTLKEKILVCEDVLESLYITKYYGTYITEEFSGSKFKPVESPVPTELGESLESLVAIQNDCNQTITLFTSTESDGPGFAKVYKNVTESDEPSEFYKAISESDRKWTDQLIERLSVNPSSEGK